MRRLVHLPGACGGVTEVTASRPGLGASCRQEVGAQSVYVIAEDKLGAYAEKKIGSFFTTNPHAKSARGSR